MQPTQRAQELRLHHAAETLEVEMEDADILLDADTPADLERIRRLMKL